MKCATVVLRTTSEDVNRSIETEGVQKGGVRLLHKPKHVHFFNYELSLQIRTHVPLYHKLVNEVVSSIGMLYILARHPRLIE